MSGKKALFTVFLAVLVDLLGFGIILPLLPYYAARFGASALQIGLLFSIYSFAQLIFSPIWGSLSDRYGRRPIMLLSTFGAAMGYVLFAFSNSLLMLFTARLLSGIMGGNISAAQAYVADVTTEKNRAQGMGMIGAAFGIGFALGPAIGALCVNPHFQNFFLVSMEHEFALPGLVAAALSILSFLLVLFMLPESVQHVQASELEEKVSVLSPAFWKNILSAHNLDGTPNLLSFLLICGFLLSFTQASLYSAFPLYCKNELELDANHIGIFFLWMGVIAIAIQGGLLRLLVKKFREEKLFVAGSALVVIGLGLLGFSASHHDVLVDLCLLSAGASLAGPTLNSMISKQAGTRKKGAMLGTAQGLSSLGRVIGPAWGGFLFAHSPRLPFLLTAALLALSFIFTIQFKPRPAH